MGVNLSRELTKEEAAALVCVSRGELEDEARGYPFEIECETCPNEKLDTYYDCCDKAIEGQAKLKAYIEEPNTSDAEKNTLP